MGFAKRGVAHEFRDRKNNRPGCLIQILGSYVNVHYVSTLALIFIDYYILVQYVIHFPLLEVQEQQCVSPLVRAIAYVLFITKIQCTCNSSLSFVRQELVWKYCSQ